VALNAEIYLLSKLDMSLIAEFEADHLHPLQAGDSLLHPQ